MEDELKQMLRKMGVSGLYKGQRTTIRAVMLVLENEDRLLNVVNEIYKVIGSEQGKSYTTIEKQLRTVVKVIWKTNSQTLMNIAGYELLYPPTASQLIEILSTYILRH